MPTNKAIKVHRLIASGLSISETAKLCKLKEKDVKEVVEDRSWEYLREGRK